MESSQKEMTERMASLLPENKKQLSLNILPRRERFEVLYRLNCDNLCADFHEDLEFRFSWGFTALITRFAGKQGHRIAVANCPQEVSDCKIVSQININFYMYNLYVCSFLQIPPCISSPADSIDSLKYMSATPNNFQARSDDWSLASRIAVASITSQGTMGGLLIAGFVRNVFFFFFYHIEFLYYKKTNLEIHLFLHVDVKNNRLEIDCDNWCYIWRFVPL